MSKGFRTRFCEYVGCQSSYFSQVIKMKPHFTLEQAQRINEFLGHSKEESKYFLLLVEYARAGTENLKNFLIEEIKEIQNKNTKPELKNKIKDFHTISKEAMQKYYSSWFYSAIHVLLSTEKYKSPFKISEHLRLPLEVVNAAISFLSGAGLIELKDGDYHLTKKRFHLEKDSVFIQNHHINWRSQALQSAEKNLPDDFHYSNVFAISEKDFFVLKEMLIKFVIDAREVIGPSKEEELYALTLDLFKV